MKRKVFSVVLAAGITLTMVSCGEGSETQSSSGVDNQSSAQSSTQIIPTSAPEAQNSEKDQIIELANMCLVESFSEENILKVTAGNKKVSADILMDGDFNDTPPDGWEVTCNNILTTSSSLREALDGKDITNIVVTTFDKENNILLTIVNEKITYSKYVTYGPGGENPSTITLDEFNAIQTGMSFQEVIDIIGGPGEKLSEVDMGMGDEYRTIVFQWVGEGSIGANANVTFQGSKVISKAQFGLQ